MRRLAGLAFGLICAAAVDAGAQPRAPNPDLARLMAHEAYARRPSPDVWASGAFNVSAAVPAIHMDPEQAYADADEISLHRDRPDAVTFEAGRMDLALTPHAFLGGGFGGQAEAGAMLTLSKGGKTVDRLRALGIGDGQAFGDQGRWYLFAAASGRAVGLNLMRQDDGLGHAGWTTDATSTLVSDAQLGLGWRKGAMQTSFGYLHREVKGKHMVKGQRTRSDEMVGLSLSVKPAR